MAANFYDEGIEKLVNDYDGWFNMFGKCVKKFNFYCKKGTFLT